MAELSNVINVGILPEGKAVAGDNMNVVAIFTSDQTKLSTNNRYELYRSTGAVDADFGTESETASFARSFFGTTPNPVSGGGGVLVMAYWRSAEETVPASAAVLTGEQLSESVTIPQLQQISDGSFKISVDGVEIDATGVDFSSVSDFSDVVTILDAEVTSGTVSEVDGRFIVTSDTTGVTSLIDYFIPSAAGTFVGALLGLNSNSLATTVQGADSSVEAPETKLEALAAVKALVNFKGFTFIDNPTDQESEDSAEWAQANDVMGYDVFDQATNLEKTSSNPVWQIKLASKTNYRMLYSKAGNRKFAATYMARAHVVLFNGENTALTMNLKELSEAAEVYSQTEIDKAAQVGLDIYTLFGGNEVPKVLTSGSNDFTDNRYNILSYKNAIQVNVFNILGITATKIAQDQAGVDKLVNECIRTTEIYRRAGVFSPGTWSSPDSFGDLDTFKRNIEANGYYFIAGSLAAQSQNDRQARKSPVIQGGLKLAGAIHSADIILSVNV